MDFDSNDIDEVCDDVFSENLSFLRNHATTVWAARAELIAPLIGMSLSDTMLHWHSVENHLKTFDIALHISEFL